MTSKQRILDTIRRRPTDRVPISMCELCPLPDNRYAPFANTHPSYARLMKVITEKTDTIMFSGPEVHYPEIEKRTERRETRVGATTFVDYILHTPKGDLTAKHRMDDDIYTWWVLEHYLKEPADIEKYLSLDFTCRLSPGKMASNKAALGDTGILCASIADPICRASELFAMEDFLMFAVTETEEAQKLLDFLWELTEYELREMLRMDMTDTMVRIVGPEYATPPYLKESYFPQFVTKYLKPMTKMINEAGAISRIHSHGKVKFALSEFARTEAMVVEPVEPIPDGDIALSEVKRLYGDRFTIMGNIELKELEYASVERIYEIVRGVMEDAKSGGGFIIMPTATPINVPLAPKSEENLIAMIEAAHQYGQY